MKKHQISNAGLNFKKKLTYWEETPVGNNLVDGGSQTKTEPKLYLFKTESPSALIS